LLVADALDHQVFDGFHRRIAPEDFRSRFGQRLVAADFVDVHHGKVRLMVGGLIAWSSSGITSFFVVGVSPGYCKVSVEKPVGPSLYFLRFSSSNTAAPFVRQRASRAAGIGCVVGPRTKEPSAISMSPSPSRSPASSV